MCIANVVPVASQFCYFVFPPDLQPVYTHRKDVVAAASLSFFVNCFLRELFTKQTVKRLKDYVSQSKRE